MQKRIGASGTISRRARLDLETHLLIEAKRLLILLVDIQGDISAGNCARMRDETRTKA